MTSFPEPFCSIPRTAIFITTWSSLRLAEMAKYGKMEILSILLNGQMVIKFGVFGIKSAQEKLYGQN